MRHSSNARLSWLLPRRRDAVAASARASDLETTVVTQAAPTGMLDAIVIGMEAAANHGADRLWITWGDQVGVQTGTLERLAAVESGTDVALPTVFRYEPYISFGRNSHGAIERVLQRREGDVMPARGESDMGVFSLSPRRRVRLARRIRTHDRSRGRHRRAEFPAVHRVGRRTRSRWLRASRSTRARPSASTRRTNWSTSPAG